jgi:uncharacterized membrane protein
VSFSLYLLVIQITVIHAICLWCVASDVVMLGVLLATLLRLRAPRTPRLAMTGWS